MYRSAVALAIFAGVILSLTDTPLFFEKASTWASRFAHCCVLNSNNYRDKHSRFDLIIAAGSIATFEKSGSDTLIELTQFLSQYKDQWKFGYLSYDLKNQLEALETNKPDPLQFADAHFFVPEHLLLLKDNKLEVISADAKLLIDEINSEVLDYESTVFQGEIKSRISKEEYISAIQEIQKEIKAGNCYEMNYCQEFYSENCDFPPLAAYLLLNKVSATPFSAFFKNNDHYIISASPERYIQKRGPKLYSQPIKGTAARGQTLIEDQQLALTLQTNPKERAENIMIVDLVRNDLTKCAVPGTVEVEELCAIYQFPQVHQMISTVSAKISETTSFTDIIQATFPMGSMTGAPKISAMQIIERTEPTRRSVYSGTLGYIHPTGDFDFNVVIRSLLYNEKNKYVSYQVGSAITADADAESAVCAKLD